MEEARIMTINHIETAEASLQGNRGNNQDRCAVISSRDTLLLVLADGLGGHPKGEVAAQILVNVSRQLFSRIFKPIQAPEQFMKACLQQAHKAILEYGSRQRPPITPRTTAVLAVIQNGMAYWAHVGDSRFYLFRDSIALAQTRDHSLAQLASVLPETERSPLQNVNRNAVTRCLGGQRMPPTATLGAPSSLSPGDCIILCSDGLWGQLKDKDIIDALESTLSFQGRISRLAQQAAKAGSPQSDNVTIVGAHWPRGNEDTTAGEDSTQTAFDRDLDAAVDHLLGLIDKPPGKT